MMLIFIGFLAIILNGIEAQVPQANLFNQNSYNQLQPFPRQPAYQPPVPILPQPGYQNYNSKDFIPSTPYQNEIYLDGSFVYGYTTANGISAQAQGFLKNAAGLKDEGAQVIQGSYSYTSPEGIPIQVNYIADENGFRAQGAHIPKIPIFTGQINRPIDYYGQRRPFQGFNPNYTPYQTNLQQFQQQQRLNQIAVQQAQDRQNSGQYQPENRADKEQQNQTGQQQQQQQQLQQTQQLLGRTNQFSNKYPYGRYNYNK